MFVVEIREGGKVMGRMSTEAFRKAIGRTSSAFIADVINDYNSQQAEQGYQARAHQVLTKIGG